ncbi:MAG: hypothetical protein MUO21_10080, partial [Nitrososphaeraceae archaeon]|nr:hypothetical protein [Nitrososphaeraceae archaeon]
TSRNYYLHAPVLKPESISICWKEPQYDKIYRYLVEEKKFNGNVISGKINELRIMYKHYISNNSNLLTLSRINRESIIKKYSSSLIKPSALRISVKS